MSTLSAERRVACRRDSPRVTEAEIAERRREVSDWQLLERDGIARLERVFHVPSFADALAFTNRVGALAEAEGSSASPYPHRRDVRPAARLRVAAAVAGAKPAGHADERAPPGGARPRLSADAGPAHRRGTVGQECRSVTDRRSSILGESPATLGAHLWRRSTLTRLAQGGPA